MWNAGVQPVRLPVRSPNLNGHLERFHLSLKSECLERMVFFGEMSLRRGIHAYLTHFHQERNHQGLGNKLLEPGNEVADVASSSAERPGGLLKYYHRSTA